jgi:hypothetical protein
VTTIPAAAGTPYVIRPSPSGQLIRLSRQMSNREVFIVFDSDAALAVADALVDAAEALTL